MSASMREQVRHFVMTRHGLASKIRALGGINDRESEATKDPHETYKPLITSQERDYFNVNLILNINYLILFYAITLGKPL